MPCHVPVFRPQAMTSTSKASWLLQLPTLSLIRTFMMQVIILEWDCSCHCRIDYNPRLIRLCLTLCLHLHPHCLLVTLSQKVQSRTYCAMRSHRPQACLCPPYHLRIMLSFRLNIQDLITMHTLTQLPRQLLLLLRLNMRKRQHSKPNITTNTPQHSGRLRLRLFPPHQLIPIRLLRLIHRVRSYH